MQFMITLVTLLLAGWAIAVPHADRLEQHQIQKRDGCGSADVNVIYEYLSVYSSSSFCSSFLGYTKTSTVIATSTTDSLLVAVSTSITISDVDTTLVETSTSTATATVTTTSSTFPILVVTQTTSSVASTEIDTVTSTATVVTTTTRAIVTVTTLVSGQLKRREALPSNLVRRQNLQGVPPAYVSKACSCYVKPPPVVTSTTTVVSTTTSSSIEVDTATSTIDVSSTEVDTATTTVTATTIVVSTTETTTITTTPITNTLTTTSAKTLTQTATTTIPTSYARPLPTCANYVPCPPNPDKFQLLVYYGPGGSNVGNCDFVTPSEHSNDALNDGYVLAYLTGGAEMTFSLVNGQLWWSGVPGVLKTGTAVGPMYFAPTTNGAATEIPTCKIDSTTGIFTCTVNDPTVGAEGVFSSDNTSPNGEILIGKAPNSRQLYLAASCPTVATSCPSQYAPCPASLSDGFSLMNYGDTSSTRCNVAAFTSPSSGTVQALLTPNGAQTFMLLDGLLYGTGNNSGIVFITPSSSDNNIFLSEENYVLPSGDHSFTCNISSVSHELTCTSPGENSFEGKLLDTFGVQTGVSYLEMHTQAGLVNYGDNEVRLAQHCPGPTQLANSCASFRPCTAAQLANGFNLMLHNSNTLADCGLLTSVASTGGSTVFNAVYPITTSPTQFFLGDSISGALYPGPVGSNLPLQYSDNDGIRPSAPIAGSSQLACKVDATTAALTCGALNRSGNLINVFKFYSNSGSGASSQTWEMGTNSGNVGYLSAHCPP